MKTQRKQHPTNMDNILTTLKHSTMNEDFLIQAVNQNPFELANIKNQTLGICKAAVETNPLSFVYIDLMRSKMSLDNYLSLFLFCTSEISKDNDGVRSKKTLHLCQKSFKIQLNIYISRNIRPNMLCVDFLIAFLLGLASALFSIIYVL